MNSASEHKDEAAAEDEGQSALIDGNYFAAIPWQLDELKAITKDPAYQEFPLIVKRLGAYQIQNWPSAAIRSPATATIFTAMSDAFLDVRVGAATPEEAVSAMTDRVERDLSEYR
jgi:hypothetical protein